MRIALRKMGNSSGVIIPKPLLSQIGAQAGDSIEMTIDAGRIVIAPVRGKSRAGWSEDSRRIAAAGDDALAWPEFGNEGDADLKW